MRRMFSEKQIKEIANQGIENAESGNIDKVLGLDNSGKIVKGNIGGSPLFSKGFHITSTSAPCNLIMITINSDGTHGIHNVDMGDEIDLQNVVLISPDTQIGSMSVTGEFYYSVSLNAMWGYDVEFYDNEPIALSDGEVTITMQCYGIIYPLSDLVLDV